MKRFKVLLLCAVMVACSLSFLACGKTPDNDGFVEVYSVSYNEAIYFSYYSIVPDYHSLQDIQETEFLDFSEERTKVYSYEQNTYDVWKVKATIDNKRSNIPNFNAGELVAYKGYTREYNEQENVMEYIPYWKKLEIKEFNLVYINVKVINDSSLDIKFENKVMRVSTDFYKIEYFN